MYVKHLRINKHYHLQDIKLGPFSQPTKGCQTITLAGPNGGGKSLILQLLANCFCNSWNLRRQLEEIPEASSYELEVGLSKHEVELLKLSVSRSPGEVEVLQYLENRESFVLMSEDVADYRSDSRIHQTILAHTRSTLKTSQEKSPGCYLGSERSFAVGEYHYNEKLHRLNEYEKIDGNFEHAFAKEQNQFNFLYDYLITMQYDYFVRLGQYHDALSKGIKEDELGQIPRDRYGEILGNILSGYSFASNRSAPPSELLVRLPSKSVVPFANLSSGEKQLMFILCFFEKYSLEESVILFDEPELHLHPALSRRIVQSLRELYPSNQIWLATQSSDVIDETKSQNLFFIYQDSETKTAVATSSFFEEKGKKLLRDFIGYSGYIGLSKALIFTEGKHASRDRVILEGLFPAQGGLFRVVPANTSSDSERINSVVMDIVEANIANCAIRVIRDRDFLPEKRAKAIAERGRGKLHVLERHEIENYLICPTSISSVLRRRFQKEHCETEVSNLLRQAAANQSGNVLREMVAYRLNATCQPEDFSVGKYLNNSVQFSADDATWNDDSLNQLRSRLEEKCENVRRALQETVNDIGFATIFDECKLEIETALTSDRWKSLFPGKEIFEEFLRLLNISGEDAQHAFFSSLTEELAQNSERIPKELSDIINGIVKST